MGWHWQSQDFLSSAEQASHHEVRFILAELMLGVAAKKRSAKDNTPSMHS
jgi:hypothetical protein